MCSIADHSEVGRRPPEPVGRGMCRRSALERSWPRRSTPGSHARRIRSISPIDQSRSSKSRIVIGETRLVVGPRSCRRDSRCRAPIARCRTSAIVEELVSPTPPSPRRRRRGSRTRSRCRRDPSTRRGPGCPSAPGCGGIGIGREISICSRRHAHRRPDPQEERRWVGALVVGQGRGTRSPAMFAISTSANGGKLVAQLPERVLAGREAARFEMAVDVDDRHRSPWARRFLSA